MQATVLRLFILPRSRPSVLILRTSTNHRASPPLVAIAVATDDLSDPRRHSSPRHCPGGFLRPHPSASCYRNNPHGPSLAATATSSPPLHVGARASPTPASSEAPCGFVTGSLSSSFAPSCVRQDPIAMGKNELLAPKAITNRVNAKGLQKLRWYCQMCRDENGFNCHCLSQMQVFGQNPNGILDGYSQEFEKAFLDHVRRSHWKKFRQSKEKRRAAAVEGVARPKEEGGLRRRLRVRVTRWEASTSGTSRKRTLGAQIKPFRVLPQDSQFWKLYKEDPPSCAIVMKTSVGIVCLRALLLEPFMPSFSKEVQKQLNFLSGMQFTLSDEMEILN